MNNILYICEICTIVVFEKYPKPQAKYNTYLISLYICLTKKT